MVSISHCGENEEKNKFIIEAAQKRFGIYGLEKTTMREIASDLKMSKGSLYYYFPDKEHLYKAVIEKEQCVFLNTLREKVEQINDPRELLMEYIKTRLYYFKSLMNLGQLRVSAYFDLKPVIGDSWQKFKENEKEILSSVFQRGIDQGIFRKKDPDRTAELFLDLLKGLRETILHKKEFLHINDEDYTYLLEKANEFTDIFINGIANH